MRSLVSVTCDQQVVGVFEMQKGIASKNEQTVRLKSTISNKDEIPPGAQQQQSPQTKKRKRNG